MYQKSPLTRSVAAPLPQQGTLAPPAQLNKYSSVEEYL
jgi:hypothetical protein